MLIHSHQLAYFKYMQLFPRVPPGALHKPNFEISEYEE